MNGEKQTLNLFKDEDELVDFAGKVSSTYFAMLQCSEAGGLATGDFLKATLLARLTLKMMTYKQERAVELTPRVGEAIAVIDGEIEKLWPIFRERLDEELAEGRDMLAKLEKGNETEQ